MLKRFAGIAGAALIGMAAATGSMAQADDFPSKPVRMLVPYGPGSGPDVVGRIVAEKMREITGQNFVVENKVGAGGIVCLEETHNADPDGYTLMVGTLSSVALVPATRPNQVPFNVREGLIPVTKLTEAPTALWVTTANFDVETIDELVEEMKGKRFLFTSGGVGTYNHIDMEVFLAAAGIEPAHVPANNSQESAALIAAGDVQGQMWTIATGLPLSSDGRIRPLAVSGSERSTLLPDVPTFDEAGYPNTGRSLWQGIFAPAGTPDAVVDKLFDLFQEAMKDEDTREKLINAGLVPAESASRAEFDEFHAGEVERFKSAVTEFNLVFE
jgi:tripartite-type tricarboxylate transporter receptor subunit TctC